MTLEEFRQRWVCTEPGEEAAERRRQAQRASILSAQIPPAKPQPWAPTRFAENATAVPERDSSLRRLVIKILVAAVLFVGAVVALSAAFEHVPEYFNKLRAAAAS